MSLPEDFDTASGTLRSEFWKFTVAALASDLPPPRLEFNFDGLKLFTLQADESESVGENEFLLLDFEDVAEKNCKSKRGFRVKVPDDESPATTGLVFAKPLPGKIESIDFAVDFVRQVFFDKASWYQTVYGHAFSQIESSDSDTSDSEDQPDNNACFDVVITRAVVHHDECTYVVDRRYSTVVKDGSNALHTTLRKSDKVIELEHLGHTALTFMRALFYKIHSNANSKP